jgi:hypothetical protein
LVAKLLQQSCIGLEAAKRSLSPSAAKGKKP